MAQKSSNRAPRDLHEFLDALRADDQLVQVDTEVDAELEVAEIHRRVIAAEGPALLFTNVRGAGFPLAMNLFGNQRRVELAFGSRPEELVQEMAKLPEELMPPSAAKLWEKRSLFSKLTRVGLKRRGRAPVNEVVDREPDLFRLPLTKSWPRDGGRFVTLPLVYTEHPGGLGHNLGMYRVQVFSEREIGLHMQIQKGGGFHLAASEALAKPFPVNVHLGGPPASILAAIAPLPENVPELLLASLALGAKLETADNPLGPLPVIAHSDFCFVGEVQPGDRRPEGPFGDHYGYYSETHDYPWMRLKGILHRKDAICPATVVGKPRQEDYFLGDYLQRLLSPLFPLVMPAVIDLWSYGETGFHSLSAAVVRERYKREAMVSAFRILGEGQLSLTKFLLVIDQGIDLTDFRSVLVHVLERADFRTDLFVFANLSMDSLDYAGPRINEGGKGVLLGLGDPVRKLPTEFSGSPGLQLDVRVFAPGCLVVAGAGFSEDRGLAARVAGEACFAEWPLIVLSDNAERASKSVTNFLWTTFTRFDPSADIHAAEQTIHHNHVGFSVPIVIDARMKPDYPEELFCDPETSDLVSRRWAEYFPAGLDMGDSDRGHLD